MTQTALDERRETARWLRQSRRNAGYSNARKFLAAVKASEGSAPSYSTYAQWESGEVSARPESLAPIVRFHEARQTTAARTSTPDLATALMALTKELEAWRTERQGLLDRVARLEAQVDELVEDHDVSGSSAPTAPAAPLESE